MSPVVSETDRRALARAARRLADAGLVLGTAGNASLRRDDQVAITATGARLAEIDHEQTTVVNTHGELVAGSLEPTSELDLHLGIYRRFGAGAVVHTHAPMATAVSCVVAELPVIHYQMLAFGGSVRVAPYATFGTQALARAIEGALEGRSACLMQNHGAVCFAGDLDTAIELALLLEWSCSVFCHAQAIGSPRVLSQAELDQVANAVTQRAYGKLQEVRRDG